MDEVGGVNVGWESSINHKMVAWEVCGSVALEFSFELLLGDCPWLWFRGCP